MKDKRTLRANLRPTRISVVHHNVRVEGLPLPGWRAGGWNDLPDYGFITLPRGRGGKSDPIGLGLILSFCGGFILLPWALHFGVLALWHQALCSNGANSRREKVTSRTMCRLSWCDGASIMRVIKFVLSNNIKQILHVWNEISVYSWCAGSWSWTLRRFIDKASKQRT